MNRENRRKGREKNKLIELIEREWKENGEKKAATK